MKITNSVIRGMVNHAKKDVPLEACGYLGAKDGIIKKIYALTNIDKSNEHFSFEPKEQFLAVKDARAQGLEICAVYHSHPASPARPSPEDIKLAYDPNMSYFIISLAGGNLVKMGASIGLWQEKEVALEIITSIKRAGADYIITYHAKDVARWIKQKNYLISPSVI